GTQRHLKIIASHYRLPPQTVGSSRNQYSNSIDLHPRQKIDPVVDRSLLAASPQKKRRCPLGKVVLSCTLPDEMPRVLGIHADGPPAMSIGSTEFSCLLRLESTLAVGNRIGIFAGRRRHEANAKYASVSRVAKAFYRCGGAK